MLRKSRGLGADLVAIRRQYSLTQSFTASILEVSVDTLARWEKDRRAIPQYVWDVLSCYKMRTAGLTLPYDKHR
jgi:DNA-binding transcriptional regulator YiaG